MTQTTLPPLASTEELSTWLGVPPDNDQLIAALNAASNRFRGAVRHPVTRVRGDVARLDGYGTTTLLLPCAPVVDVASVEVNGTPTEDYEWSEMGALYRQQGWPRKYRSVQVTYDHGYDLVPGEIAEVVIDQARSLYRVHPGISSVTTSVESLSFGTAASVGVTAQWSAVVEAYRLNRGERC